MDCSSNNSLEEITRRFIVIPLLYILLQHCLKLTLYVVRFQFGQYEHLAIALLLIFMDRLDEK